MKTRVPWLNSLFTKDINILHRIFSVKKRLMWNPHVRLKHKDVINYKTNFYSVLIDRIISPIIPRSTDTLHDSLAYWTYIITPLGSTKPFN